MKIYKKLLNVLKKDSSPIYYQSIDELPLENWFKLNSGELKYIIKNDGEFKEYECSNEWTRLYDEYLSRFGAGRSYNKYLQANVDLINARLEFVVKRDRKILNKVDRLEAKIENMLLNNGNSHTPHQVLFHLSKFGNQKMSLKNTTVSEYFTAIEEFEKYLEETAKNNKRNG